MSLDRKWKQIYISVIKMAKKGVIKNRLYYKSSDMINIENIVLQNIRVDKKLFKDIITYYIRYGAVDGVKTCDFILH